MTGSRRHLGRRVSAYVDDGLGPGEHARAVEHLARCRKCQAAVERERWLSTRLRRLPDAEPSAALLQRLRQVGAAAQPVRAGGPAAPATRVPRARWLLAGTGSAVAGLLGVAYVVGADPARPAPVSPPVQQFTAEFAGTDQPPPYSSPAVDVTSVLHSDPPAASGP